MIWGTYTLMLKLEDFILLHNLTKHLIHPFFLIVMTQKEEESPIDVYVDIFLPQSENMSRDSDQCELILNLIDMK